jgi:hypothetical protein
MAHPHYPEPGKPGLTPETTLRLHYIALRMRACASRVVGEIDVALHLEGEAEGMTARAAVNDYDVESWSNMESECDDLAATGWTPDDWVKLMTQALIP